MFFDLVQIADARQLHQNLIGAQAVFLNQRLAHAQRIHAIANGLNGLVHRRLSRSFSNSGFMVSVQLLSEPPETSYSLEYFVSEQRA